jgi:multiple sugar transport system permease protein
VSKPVSVRPPPAAKPLNSWEFWGRILVLPYLLVFVVFVLYPVGYGLWLARHPDSYVKLAADPIFFRTVVNTVVFLVVAINVKMAVALGLSGFFVQSRWWIKILSVLFILPWAVPSHPDHPVGALHAQPRVGRDQQH